MSFPDFFFFLQMWIKLYSHLPSTTINSNLQDYNLILISGGSVTEDMPALVCFDDVTEENWDI